MSLPSDLNPLTLSGSRRVSPVFSLNGTVLPGLIDAEVTNASHFTSDTFRATLALSALPAAYGAAYWSQAVGDEVGISVVLDGESPMPLILGQVDEVDYDPIARQITLTGRDLSAPLIDAKTSEKFVNQTSSEIARTLAARHGLQASVRDTATKAGTYYSAEHIVLTQEMTEWDLLIYLAEREGFDVWVSGNTLYFQPSPLGESQPYRIMAEAPANAPFVSNATRIRLSRSQTLAKDVIVIVQSWNQKQQRPFKVTYKVTQAKKSQRAGGKAQIYSFNVPNLTRDKANQLAKARAEEITRHEKILTATLPGDSRLSTRAPVQLVGTNTDWDQLYFPDSITRRVSFEEGYHMELRAKNHSTQSTVVIG